MSGIHVSPACAADDADWLAMRNALWPRSRDDEHRADIEAYDETARSPICLIARDEAGVALGFAEAALRHDYVNGCKTSPVAFLEGIYVRPQARGRGVARKLVVEVEAWALGLGCTEFASDAALDNVESHAMHKALGFTETQRVVYFRKLLSS
ncbi:aminoglycoside 6'-acetyltransferase [Devosia geojensis]|uniref:Aminoglycoside N(6')-acetyltransferase type 1 n=1 Tax=Devosia geojensis TaxID=443610 RepID=A0A0F5FVV3_9HYPH|nr:aminoglycoside 6'-N-acetyltransferase [Devosia geojensis]KKB12685.1 aminoglycoside 6'-acetyltransferase [Devosia geojensis]